MKAVQRFRGASQCDNKRYRLEEKGKSTTRFGDSAGVSAWAKYLIWQSTSANWSALDPAHGRRIPHFMHAAFPLWLHRSPISASSNISSYGFYAVLLSLDQHVTQLSLYMCIPSLHHSGPSELELTR